jgi:polar amino acid transport system substrate-binding protein
MALLGSVPAAAQPPLRWGMDETGGAPYVYDMQTKGFEVELAAYLAKQLGRKSEPVSGDWNKLPELLNKPADENGIDVVLNGYEHSKTFRDQASIPYYIYRLTLTVKKNSDIKAWEDLRRRKADGSKHKVVVLTGSAALRYMQANFKDDVDLESSDDVSNAFDLVGSRNEYSATVQDNPSAIYFVQTKADPKLRILDDRREPNFYVILTRRDDKQLRADIDDALRKAIHDGALEAILRKYHLWNDDQERLRYWSEAPWPPGSGTRPAGDNEEKAQDETSPLSWPEVLKSLGLAASRTILLAVTSFPLAVLIGLLIAIARVYGPSWLRIPGAIYVEIIRGTPLLLQLFLIFYILPKAFPYLPISPIQAGIIGLAINYGAYEAENFRAGLQAVARGQMEAALSLGMTPLTAIRRVVVPQAFRVVIPPITNDFIALFKDTSVCSVILITELSREFNVLSNNHREYMLVFAALTAGIYLLMSYPLSLLARYVERRFRRGQN